MKRVLVLSFVCVVGVCLLQPSVAFANIWPELVSFCTAEDGSGNCTTWNQAWYDDAELLATFETCQDRSMSCIVWFVCNPISISAYQVALYVNNDYTTYDYDGWYWDVDGSPIDWNTGCDLEDEWQTDLYRCWEWVDQASPNGNWDYGPGDYVARAEFYYWYGGSYRWSAIELWMGNSTDC